ncbi:hypothetical protein AB0L35_07530 [Streptomyces sp. NPDC052309]|uniref:hypothetical protein n=1 Tax=Streptomyces sp. NPDC052309 TaxID=3155421 RepID=UPI003415991E
MLRLTSWLVDEVWHDERREEPIRAGAAQADAHQAEERATIEVAARLVRAEGARGGWTPWPSPTPTATETMRAELGALGTALSKLPWMTIGTRRRGGAIKFLRPAPSRSRTPTPAVRG